MMKLGTKPWCSSKRQVGYHTLDIRWTGHLYILDVTKIEMKKVINVSNYMLIRDIDIGTVIKEVVVLLNETNAVLKGE